MNKNIASSIFYNMLFQLFVSLLPLLTTPYISRTLGVEKSGIFSYVDSIVTIVFTIGSIGTFLYGCRKIAYYRDNYEKSKEITNELIVLKLLLGFIVLIVYIPSFCIFSKYSEYFLIFIITIIGNALDVTWYFTGIEEFKKITARNFIIKIIFIICLFLFVHKPSDLEIYIFLVSLSGFIGNIAMWAYLPNDFLNLKKVNLKKSFLHIKESFTLFIPQTANYIYTLSDRSMLGLLLSDISCVGIYDYAQRIIRMILGILQSIGYVILSRISNLNNKKENSKISEYIYKSINLTLLLACPMMCGLISIAQEFIPLYLGEQYNGVIIVIYVLSPLILMTSLNSSLGVQLMLPLKMDKKYIKSTVTGAIINIILNLVMIPLFKIIGACIASVISEIIIFIMQINYTREIISLKRIIKENYKYLIISIFLLLINIMLSFIEMNTIFVLLLQVFIFIILYFLILICLKDEMIIKIINFFLRRGKND